MSLPLPSSLSPSKVTAFRDCALAFRFSAVDRLREPPTTATVRGTLVHRALERLFWHLPAGSRDRQAALHHLEAAWEDLADEISLLGMDGEQAAGMRREAVDLIDGYFRLEDPNSVRAVGMELMMEATLGDVLVRGIIDRLDIDDDGQYVVTDYKTGRPPSSTHESQSLTGVHFYSLLCEEVLGVRPVRVQLLYLREPLVLEARPSEQAMAGLRRRTAAIWSAVERACMQEDFRPRPSALCGWCAWQQFCPAYGGDPSLARETARAGR
ncbi:MAG: RecB family exonuclease [Acidimicrobiales bacterium]